MKTDAPAMASLAACALFDWVAAHDAPAEELELAANVRTAALFMVVAFIREKLPAPQLDRIDELARSAAARPRLDS